MPRSSTASISSGFSGYPVPERLSLQQFHGYKAAGVGLVDFVARIDQINTTIHPVNGSAQFEGPQNRYQARQQERVAEIQLQLDAQKRKLAEMQEAARHAGMHTTVYDP